MRKYFLSKFTSYSLLSALSQFSLSLLCVCIICWFVLFFVRICVLFFICDFFDFGWEDLDFLFGSILPWNVIFLFSSFHLMSVSLPTIYNRITSFFQVIRKQVKCMKYFFGKFHSNSLISNRSLCVLCLGIILWLYVCVIKYI